MINRLCKCGVPYSERTLITLGAVSREIEGPLYMSNSLCYFADKRNSRPGHGKMGFWILRPEPARL